MSKQNIAKISGRVLPLCLAGFVGGWGALIFQSAYAQEPTMKIVRANQFQLTNSDGRLQASITSGPCPVLMLYNSNGTPGLAMSTMNDRPAIYCFDAKGYPALSMGIDKFGKPEVSIGTTNPPNMKLFYSPENMPALMLMNSRAESAVLMSIDKDGSGTLLVGDGYGKSKFAR